MLIKRITFFIALLLILGNLYAIDSDMRFIENKGQWEDQIKYNVRLNFGNIYFEKDKFTFLLQDYTQHSHGEVELTHDHKENKGHHFNISFEGANPNVTFSYSGKSEHYFNFLLGNDPSKWASQVFEYESLSYKNLYNGIDMNVKGAGEDLKYEYYVAPQSDPNQIQVKYNGIEKLSLRNGDLFYHTAVCDIIERAPYAYQIIQGQKVEVLCQYKLGKDQKSIQFDFPKSYNKNYELVIDPTLVFARLSNSTSDNFGFTATYDSIGRAYAGGIVFGASGQYITTLGSFRPSFIGGSTGTTGGSPIDIGISCYHQTTGALIYGTYVGGTGNELPNSMVVNHQGELVVLATTGSNDFPLGASSYDNSFNGGQIVNLQNNGIYFPNGCDIAIFKLNNSGTNLVAGTYVGGTGNDGLNDDLSLQLAYSGTDLHFNYGDAFRGEIIIDSADNVYIASSTNSLDFPTQGVITSLQGEQDAVVVKLSPNLNNLIFSRYLGGNNDDAGYSIKIDGNNNLFVVGGTMSTNFPITGPSLNSAYQGGNSDGYVAKLNNFTGGLIRSSFIGTAGYDQVYFVDLDENNMVYIVGQTNGTYAIVNAGFSSVNGRQFIHKLNNDLSTTSYSTVFGTGGANIDISPTALLVDVCERVYVSGWGGNTNQNRNGGLSNSNISGMPVTFDAIQSNTSGGGDFYFFVLDKNASGQLYGSYNGGTAAEHVDGGTSRFDENGIIYQAICAACGGGSFASSPAYSSSSSSNNCNVGLVKMDIGLPVTNVEVDAFPRATGCVPLTVNFQSILEDVTDFVWYFGDGDSSTLPFPVHTYVDTGLFTVLLIGTDVNSCNQVDSAYLTVSVSNDTLIASTIDTIFTDCDSLSVFVEAIDVATTTYDWFMGDGTQFMDGGHTIDYTYGAAGFYEIILHVTDTTKCETEAWDTIGFTLKPTTVVQINAQPTASGCLPLTVNFESILLNVADFVWSFGDGDSSLLPSPTHTYVDTGIFTAVLIGIDTSSCNQTDTALLTVSVSQDTLTVTTIDTFFINCDSLSIFVGAIDTPGTTYDWFMGDGTVFLDAGNIINYTYAVAGLYEVVLSITDTTKCNPMAFDTIQFEFAPKIQAAFNANSTCVGSPLTMQNLSNPLSETFIWDFGNGENSNEFEPTVTYTAAGNYTITLMVIDSAFCNFISGDTQIINIVSLPFANFTTDTNYYIYPDLVQFTNLSYNYDSFLWTFGDGESDSTNVDPTHFYKSLGSFEPCLKVSNQGCEDTICLDLFIDYIPLIGVPNAFSPNGDGINDLIKVEGLGIVQLAFRIYNRWGELVYEGFDQDEGWDGNFRGIKQEMEVYTYIVDANLLDGSHQILKGNITLLR